MASLVSDMQMNAEDVLRFPSSLSPSAWLAHLFRGGAGAANAFLPTLPPLSPQPTMKRAFECFSPFHYTVLLRFLRQIQIWESEVGGAARRRRKKKKKKMLGTSISGGRNRLCGRRRKRRRGRVDSEEKGGGISF